MGDFLPDHQHEIELEETMTHKHSFASAVTAGLLSALSLALVSPASAALIDYSAILDGASEAPPNASPATGSTVVTYDDMAHTLRVVVSFSGLTGTVTAAHIHCCTVAAGAGTAAVATPTPSFPDFPFGVTSGSYDQTFDLTMDSSYRAGFITANGGTAASAEAALASGMAAGKAYLNIHTTTFGGGEIRGFLPEPASMALMGIGLFGLAALRRRGQPQA